MAILESLADLFTIPDNAVVLDGSYNYWLVTLSIIVAIFSSYSGLKVLELLRDGDSRLRRHTTIFIAALGLAVGVWSMHFIGMTAFQLCNDISYDKLITFISFIPSLAASWIALNLINSSQIKLRQIVIGGVLVGAGIGAMHYIGMAAMEMSPLLRYDKNIFLLSIIVAVGLASLSLWVKFALTTKLPTPIVSPIAAIIMGLAISGMHYTGMESARFIGTDLHSHMLNAVKHNYTIGLTTGLVTLFLLGLVISINYTLKYRDLLKLAHDSEVRIRSILDTAIDSVITLDKHGIILSVNSATEAITGWKEKDLIGTRIISILPSSISAELNDQINNGVNHFIGKSRDLEIIKKDGTKADVRAASGAFSLAGEDFYVVFISDLHERKQMENKLRENESKFRSLITNIPGIAYRCLDRPRWPMLYVSEAVEEITGYPPECFTLPNPKRTFEELIVPEDLQSLKEHHDSSYFNHEYRIRTKNGDIKWVMETGIRIRDPNSGEPCLDGFIMDMTARKHLEKDLIAAKEKAESSAAAKTAFTANMSHEIRTPMNAIIGFADLLLDSELNKSQKDQLRSIETSAKSLLHLLNDILDNAKLEKGKMELSIRPFDIQELVENSISIFTQEAKKKKIQLSLDLPNQIHSWYLGDPDKIKQILNNLIANAVKFTNQGSVIVALKANEGEKGLEFSIKDTGIGMTDNQCKSIFSAYVQADSSISRKFGGTGLGTTISKRLVELMGGSIEVSSAINKGSEFKIYLPLQRTIKSASIRPISEITLPRLNILIADDIQQNLDLLATILENDNHQVTSVEDGERLLAALRSSSNFDLVISDIHMPNMDGLTACSEQRKFEAANSSARLPFIALSASVYKDDKQKALDTGFDGFASKPIDWQDLKQVIATVLGFEITQEKESPGFISSIPSNHRDSIDFEKGRELWGSEEKHRSECKGFLKNFSSKILVMGDLARAKKLSDLKQHYHAMKGVCGNLALSDLATIWAELEKNYQNLDSKWILDKQDELQRAANKINDLLASDQSLDTQATPILNPDEFKLIAGKLLELIAKNQVNDELCDDFAAQAPEQYRDLANDIHENLSNFEFESAQSLLEQLIKRID